MSLGPKGAFIAHPLLARRVALKRSMARFVLFCEKLAPLMLVPMGILALFLATAWFGLFRQMPDLMRWLALGLFIFAFLSSLLPVSRLRWPAVAEADRLLEERNHLPHQPVAVQEDAPALDTPFARALWKEHQLRMAQRIAGLDAGLPQPDIARHDRFALRAIPALLLVAAFGYSYSNGGGSTLDVFQPTPPAASIDPDLRIDAWLTPPAYTAGAPVFLTGREAPVIGHVQIPQNSELTVRVTGGEGGETVHFAPMEGGIPRNLPPIETKPPQTQTTQAAAPRIAGRPLAPRTYTMKVTESGDLSVNGQQWLFDVIADRVPEIAFDKQPRRSVNGALEIGFTGRDDYGIQRAFALIEPAEPQAANARSLYPLPEYRLDLPRNSTREVKGLTSRNLSEHPLAGKRVRITLVAIDGAGQEGRSPPVEMVLPGRRFVEPLAAAVAEQRQVFALDTRQMPRAIALNEVLALRPDETIPNLSHYLLIRSALARMKLAYNDELLKNTADYLWEIALGIEDGDLTAAERRLRDAQQALSKALENGATDQEIARLMKELREAMQSFMSELAQRMQNMPQTPQQNMQSQNVLRQRDLQNMMDQIENLARSGNRDAAQQMLSQLQHMMNNLQAGRPQRQQQGQQQNSQMRQQIDKLGELMQEQQRLMDQTFQLNQALRDRMQRGNPNQQGQQQPGQQQQGQQGQRGEQQTDQMTAEQLREALKNLRAQQEGLGKKLKELQEGLKGLGMDPGKGFGEAEREMGNAGEALGEGQGDQAVEGQSNALNALRQGAQSMMQQMMQAMQQGQGEGQGEGEGMASQGGQNGRDPLGRRPPDKDNDGDQTGGGPKVPNQIDTQQAREILETIREKLGNSIRERLGNSLSSEEERRYLERLLDMR
ncbi:TIGR02302 family protein [Rhizobium sp. FY34]|uniref:TIGR02302 family protein n=1 Tax=Rhizobium sp. FY34 TaxID=2562309 RepID=UPI0010C00929|nr:TIGR02302 family protein [Rhizobium sp. FY34]